MAACADDVLFYSLQLGGPAAEAANPPSGLDVIGHTARIADFADTAGLVSLLDLVIAGRTNRPWYRTMQVFTQPEPFNWEVPVARIAARLRSVVDEPMVHGNKACWRATTTGRTAARFRKG